MGAMLGIGGGIVLVPLLTLGFDLPMEEAVPASLLCVVASSCGAASSYLQQKLCDVRLALSLEVATVGGALAGGAVAGLLSPTILGVTLGAFLLCTGTQLLVVRLPETPVGEAYRPANYPLGMTGSFLAGGLSALLGVGGGPLKVPLMTFGMRVPFKVATATSNLMIGVTAAASVAGYALRGHLHLGLVAPLVVGVLAGATVGTRLMPKVPVALLKKLFALVLLGIAAQLLWKGGHSLWTSG
jgi:hypothetical protein